MNRYLVTIPLAALLLMPLIASTAGVVGAEASELEILPTDDSHVNEGTPGSVADSGVRYNMYVGWDEQVYLSERIYLKFDLSEIPAGSTIESAVLKIYNKYSPSIGESPYTEKTLVVDAENISDDSWEESTLTWNNAPPMGPTVFDSQTIDRGLGDPGSDPESWEWWSFDVTSYVTSEFAGDGVASIGLISQNEGTDDASVWVYSKDAGEEQPRVHLEVSYTTGPLPGVSVSISPASKTGEPGDNLEYTVTVTNNTGAENTFDLTAEPDNTEWATSISPDSLTLADGASDTATLRVTVPDTAEEEDSTTITVTASDGATDSETCTATATTEAPPSVSVSISPTSNTGNPSDELEYTVTVTNTGGASDTFDLSASDTAGWSPDISPSSLTVADGDSDTATLSVTIPSTAEDGASTTITVTASDGATDSKTCTATVEVEEEEAEEKGLPWIYIGAAVVVIVIIVAAIAVIR